CFTATELLQRQSSCATTPCKLWLAAGVMLGGGFWALPIAVPAGVLVSLVVLLLGKLIGVLEAPWWPGRTGRRAGAVIAIMALQSGLGFWLRHVLTV
ncbi:MAG: hypothetical protein ACRENE_19405, partial [Polyangiaceae bacterium]